MSGKKRGGRHRRPPRSGKKGEVKKKKKAEEEVQDHGKSSTPSAVCPLCRSCHGRSFLALSKHFSQDHPKEEVAEALAKLLQEVANKRTEEEEEEVEVEVDRLELRESPPEEEAQAASPSPPSPSPPPRPNKKDAPSSSSSSDRVSLTCGVCQKTFASKGNLVKHSVRHSEEKPFKCKECGQSFNQKRDLRSHEMQRHTGERPHVCNVRTRVC